jgi:hypothetical protein
MKISRKQLRRIIKEETRRVHEIDFFDETQSGQVITAPGEGDRMKLQNQFEGGIKSIVVKVVKAGLSPTDVVAALERMADKYRDF